jgi:hypothetical protein
MLPQTTNQATRCQQEELLARMHLEKSINKKDLLVEI